MLKLPDMGVCVSQSVDESKKKPRYLIGEHLPPLRLILLGLTILFLMASCREKNTNTESAEAGTFPVASVFSDFYEKLGGEEILGPAISPWFTKNSFEYQFTLNALLVYDPDAPSSQRVGLAPLAQEWGIEQSAEPPPKSTSGVYLNGHNIWEEVLDLYQQHGSRVLGLPLTGVTFNHEKQRYEQYLTNVGFYRWANDPPGEIHLLPYGAWMCGESCEYSVEDALPQKLPLPPADEEIRSIDEIFMQVSSRLGTDFTGAALTLAYLADDGNYEKIYENIVLFTNPLTPTQVSLRPLPSMIGILPDPPVPQNPNTGMYFYPVENDLGYNVPVYFLDAITMHGTMEIAGAPFTELHATAKGSSQQCFTNICLEYLPSAPASLRIRPSPLGYEYLKRMSPIAKEIPPSQEPGMIGLQVWERYPLLPLDESQEFGIAIYEDNLPLQGVDFTLKVVLPDGTSQSYYLLPTNEQGKTSMSLDPIDAPNGAVIPYQVCVIGLTNPAVCVVDTFVIWDNP
jgi:hypothetical protein